MNITALIIIFILFLLALLVMKIIGKMVRFAAITLVLILIVYSGWFFLEYGRAPNASDITGAATSIDAVNKTIEKATDKKDARIDDAKQETDRIIEQKVKENQRIRDEMLTESANSATISIS